MASRSLYGQEPANIAKYDFDLLKVNKGAVKPRDPTGLLPPDAQAILKHFDTQIELTADELADRLRGPLTKPHWDPRLSHSRRERRRLLLHLASLRLVGFRTRIKAKAGMFFVKKRWGPTACHGSGWWSMRDKLAIATADLPRSSWEARGPSLSSTSVTMFSTNWVAAVAPQRCRSSAVTLM